jgi:hypothetical protein
MREATSRAQYLSARTFFRRGTRCTRASPAVGNDSEIAETLLGGTVEYAYPLGVRKISLRAIGLASNASSVAHRSLIGSSAAPRKSR